MKVIRLLVVLGILALTPVAASARLGATLQELYAEGLMRQFEIRSTIKGGVSHTMTYHLTPALPATKDKVKMILQFDDQQKLANVELWISAEYRKADPTNAKRMAAMFLLTQLDVRDTAAVKVVATEAEYRREDKNHYVLGEIPPLPAKSTPTYLAITGKGTVSHSYKRSKFSVTQVNSGQQWTKIRVDKK